MKKEYFINLFNGKFDAKIKVTEKEFKKQLEYYCDRVEHFKELKCLMFPLNNKHLQIVFYNVDINFIFDVFGSDFQSILSILDNYESLKDELNVISKLYLKN